MRTICISCGNAIEKSAEHDPFICRECEHEKGTDLDQYWLD